MSSAESLLVQQTLEQIEQELGAGMVPHIFQLLESQPLMLIHLWGQFRATILHGHLPRVLKEMIGLVVATATHCDYVQNVHLHSLSLQGMDEQALEAVRRGDYGTQEIGTVARNALRFTALATATRAAYASLGEGNLTWQKLRQQTAQALEATGLEEEEKFEMVATVALFEQFCSVANLLALDSSHL
jgi:AhpD family alkylhydroperoxidase